MASKDGDGIRKVEPIGKNSLPPKKDAPKEEEKKKTVNDVAKKPAVVDKKGKKVSKGKIADKVAGGLMKQVDAQQKEQAAKNAKMLDDHKNNLIREIDTMIANSNCCKK